MRKSPRRTIKGIIEAAGGADAIAAALGGSLTSGAVYKWVRIGIPDRHWPVILAMASATADEMMAANIAARSKEAVAG